MKSRLAFVLVAFCIIHYFGNIGPFPRLAGAQVARIEIRPVKTMTLTDEQFLTGVKDGKPDVIGGELRIPRPGTDRLPAMVLVHGSGGIGGNVDNWSQELNKIGIATFILDGFTGRGIVDVGTDQRQLGMLTMINDAYRVLELLAKHPRIDPSRIGIMGFSRGGMVALYASVKRFQRMHGPGDIEFAAYVGFYTPCYITFIDDGELSDRPIRLFHGSADDYVPVGPCQEYVKRLQKAGKNVQLVEYSDAYHVFDYPAFKTPLRVPEAQTVRNCRLEENPAGQIINSRTKKPVSVDPCTERGATVAYNAQAHSEAVKDVKQFLTMTFKLK
jgi:dienelactone hydrolase